MISVEFNSISWMNFNSYGNYWTTISLDEHNTNLFLGASGSGKSTFLDVLSYCIFGKPYRKVTLSSLINSINQKGLHTKASFTIGGKKYELERGQKPKIIKLFCNGNEVQEADIQKHLEQDILKLNYKTFKQIIALGYANFTPFFKLDPKDRREMVDEILDTGIVSKMNEVNKTYITKNNLEIRETEQKIELVNNKILYAQSALDELKADNSKIISETEEKIAEIEVLLEEKQAKSEEINAKMKAMNYPDDSELMAERDRLLASKTNLLSKIKTAEKEVAYYKSYDKCSECDREIDKKWKKNEISAREESIEQYNAKLAALQPQEEEINKKISALKQEREAYQSVKSDLRQAGQEVSSAEEALASWQKVRKGLDKKESFEEKEKTIKEKKKELKSLSLEMETLREKEEIYSTMATILKDNGVKAEIVKQYIPKINALMNKLLTDMDFFITFNMDENFNEVIKSRGRDEFIYDNFSDGERQRIDLAILFTWVYIAKIKSSVNTNLLVLDEVLDSHLSPEAAENVVSLLSSEIFKGTNVFVISHKESLQDKFDNVVFFENVKGFSRVAEH